MVKLSFISFLLPLVFSNALTAHHNISWHLGFGEENFAKVAIAIGVRGGEDGRPPCLQKFQGKLCFQGKRKLFKNLE